MQSAFVLQLTLVVPLITLHLTMQENEETIAFAGCTYSFSSMGFALGKRLRELRIKVVDRALNHRGRILRGLSEYLVLR